jgi:hypothetical protein
MSGKHLVVHFAEVAMGSPSAVLDEWRFRQRQTPYPLTPEKVIKDAAYHPRVRRLIWC